MTSQPALFAVTPLPFDDQPEGVAGPVEAASPGMPPLFGPRPGQETDCANALLEGRWADAEALLLRLHNQADDRQSVEIDEALTFVRELLSRPALPMSRHLDLLLAARLTAGNCWVRHASVYLVRTALASMGLSRLASTLDVRAFPFVYRLIRHAEHESLGLSKARALLRDALAHGRDVPLAELGDSKLLDLEDEERSAAWYPVLGALAHLWDVPKWSLTGDDQCRLLEDALPEDDEGRAMRFWQVYQLWRAQKERSELCSRARVVMKSLDPGLFDRLKG